MYIGVQKPITRPKDTSLEALIHEKTHTFCEDTIRVPPHHFPKTRAHFSSKPTWKNFQVAQRHLNTGALLQYIFSFIFLAQSLFFCITLFNNLGTQFQNRGEILEIVYPQIRFKVYIFCVE